MKIHVEDNIYLESDEYQYILREDTGREDKKGRKIYSNIGYYANITQAINKLVDMKIKESTANTLGELLAEVKEIQAYVDGLLI